MCLVIRVAGGDGRFAGGDKFVEGTLSQDLLPDDPTQLSLSYAHWVSLKVKLAVAPHGRHAFMRIIVWIDIT